MSSGGPHTPGKMGTQGPHFPMTPDLNACHGKSMCSFLTCSVCSLWWWYLPCLVFLLFFFCSAIPTSRYILSQHHSVETQCWKRRFIHNYYLQCACTSNWLKQRNSVMLHVPVTVFIALRWHSKSDYRFCLWIYLPGVWIHNQDYEYWACSVHPAINIRGHSCPSTAALNTITCCVGDVTSSYVLDRLILAQVTEYRPVRIINLVSCGLASFPGLGTRLHVAQTLCAMISGWSGRGGRKKGLVALIRPLFHTGM